MDANRKKMKNIIWILLSTLLFNLITISYCTEYEDELNVYLESPNSTLQETSYNQTLDAEQTNSDNDEFELDENIDEASSEIVESQVPLPTDKTTEIESEVPIRKPRRKRRRRRKRPRTSTHNYEENINHPVRYQEPLESDYAEGYVRRRPMKRRRRPIQRRPLIEGGGEEENILPRRKLIRRPAEFGNKTRNEEVKQWEPITSTEEGKWKPIKTTTETENTITTITPKSNTIVVTTTTTPKMTTVAAIFSTTKLIEDNINQKDALLKKSNSSRADFIVLHKRPINSNLPPTSAVIRRRLKPQNNTSEETSTIKPKIIVTKEELPSSLLPPGFKVTENAPSSDFINNTETYQINDEALTKIMKEPNNKNDEFKFKSDSIPKVKDEILSLLKTKTGSSLLLNVLNLRNMSLEELLQHRERGSSQRHQELINTKDEPIDLSSDEPIVSNDIKNFTNYLIETKRLAQNNKESLKTEELNTLQLFTENTKDLTTQEPKHLKNLNEEKQNEQQENNKPNEQILISTQEITNEDTKSKIPIETTKEVKFGNKNITVTDTLKKIDPIKKVEEREKNEELSKFKLHNLFEKKKEFSFPTTTYTTTNVNYQESEATSFVSKTPKTKIILETSEREPRLFDSLPDFTIKTTSKAPIIPTIPSQVLFIQDTNHLDKYQSYEEKNKDVDEDNNLVYRRFEMRKLPVAVKSAIIASAAILAVAILGFFVLLISCRMRQKKRVLRKKSIFCQHNLHHDPDLRSSARSTSPVMDPHCQDQYYDGYGGRIDTHTTANRQYYLWRTLRKTFRYD